MKTRNKMAKQDNKQEIEFELTKFNPNSIVDFSEWEKRQQQTLADNPFIEVNDRETWEIGKARRTALRTARTDLQKERDAVKKELNNVKTFVVNKYDEFINITTPAEEKQQETVKAFEAELEAEKQREAELEQQRVDDIRHRIDEIESKMDAVVLKMTVQTIDESQAEFDDLVTDANAQNFDEFGFLMNEAIERQTKEFDEKAIQLKVDEQRRIDDLKVKQQSMINELYVQANQAIDVMVFDTIPETTKKIDKIFSTDFDFGEFRDKFESVANQMFTKLDRTIETMKKDREEMAVKEREFEMNRQRNRIVEIREGLLDLVFQMTVDNHQEQTGQIKSGLEQPDKLNDELVPDWEKMVGQVKTAFNQKMELINGQIKQREFEKEQEQRAKDERIKSRTETLKKTGFITDDQDWTFNAFRITREKLTEMSDVEFNEIIRDIEKTIAENKIHNQRWDTRKPLLEKNGFVYDENAKRFNHKTFSAITVALETVLTNGDESWRLVMNDLMDDISTAKAKTKAEKARQKKIKHDKSNLTEWINHAVRKNKSNIAELAENPEMKEFHHRMVDELNAWCDAKVDQIKKF